MQQPFFYRNERICYELSITQKFLLIAANGVLIMLPSVGSRKISIWVNITILAVILCRFSADC